MTELAVATEDLEISHVSGSDISSGAFVPTSDWLSAFTKVDGRKIYGRNVIYTFSGGNASGFVPGSVETVIPNFIYATPGIKTKDNGWNGIYQEVLREEDSATMNCIGELTGGGTGAVAGPVEVSDAGQTKWRAE